MNSLDRGIDASARGDFRAAIEACTEAIKTGQRLPLAYRYRGHAFMKIGDWDQAIADLTRAIDLDRSAANPFANRGYAFLSTGDYARAISDYTEAIRINPAVGSNYLYRGHGYLKMDDWELALADFMRATEVGMDSEYLTAESYAARGFVRFWQTDDFGRAIADLDEALRHDPANAHVFYFRAQVYQAVGEADKAEADFTEAKRLGYVAEGEEEVG